MESGKQREGLADVLDLVWSVWHSMDSSVKHFPISRLHQTCRVYLALYISSAIRIHPGDPGVIEIPRDDQITSNGALCHRSVKAPAGPPPLHRRMIGTVFSRCLCGSRFRPSERTDSACCRTWRRRDSSRSPSPVTP